MASLSANICFELFLCNRFFFKVPEWLHEQFLNELKGKGDRYFSDKFQLGTKTCLDCMRIR